MDSGSNPTSPSQESLGVNGQASKPTLGQKLLRNFRPRQAAAYPLISNISVGSFSSKSPAAVASPASSSAPASASVAAPPDSFSPGVLADVYGDQAEKLAPLVPKTASAADALIAELKGPLPVGPSEKRNQQTTLNCLKLHALILVVRGAVASEQEEEESSANDRLASSIIPSISPIFRLCLTLLQSDASIQSPTRLRICATDLLAIAIKLADVRADAESRTSTGSARLTSDRSPNQGQDATVGAAVKEKEAREANITSIDRAIFYRAVCSLSKTLPEDGTPMHQIRAAQIRALCVLSKDGREVVAFPGLIGLLCSWMKSIWLELLAVRAQARSVPGITEQASEAQAADARSIATDLAVREWNFHTILELISNSFKFSFARIPLNNIQSTLRALYELVMPLDMIFEHQHHATSASLKDPSSSTTLGQSIASLKPASSAHPNASPLMGPQRRSRSKERKPMTEGYSYYGLELGSSESPSPSATPKLTPQMKSKPLPADLASPPRPVPAPIALATIAPNATKSEGRRSMDTEGGRDQSAAGFQDARPIDPLSELHPDDMSAIFKVLDSTLRFGFVPPPSVTPIILMLCRIMGRDESTSRGRDGKTASSTTDDWQAQALRIENIFLRSHYANSAIRAVLDMLTNVEQKVHDRSKIDLTLKIGALRFIRLAARYIDELAEEKEADAAGGKAPQENALAPSLTLATIMPALSAMAKLESDALDLELIEFFAVILPKDTEDHEKKASCLMPRTQMDWDSLLELTIIAKRHLQALRSNLGAPSFFPTSKSSARPAKHMPGDPQAVGNVILSFLGLLADSRFADPSQNPTVQDPGSVQHTYVIPWSSKLASLILSLSPLLPDEKVTALVDYYWSANLCLPCTADWILNIKALLQAIFYRSESAAKEFGSEPAPAARKRVVSLVFEHVYVAVFDLPHHRARLMLEVILPLAQASLGTEIDTFVLSKIRNALVEAAASAGIADGAVARLDVEETEASEPILGTDAVIDDDSNVFNGIRELLSRLVRTAPAPREDKVFCLHSANRVAAPKSVLAVLDMIAIFNRMAFTSLSLLGSKSEQELHLREITARRHCVLLFRDIVEIIEDPASSHSEDEETRPQAKVPVLARLCALQWALRLRTDRRHRLYLLNDLDEYIEPYANLLGRGREVHSPPSTEDPNARIGRSAERVADGNVDRSKSRLREESRERGRARDDPSRRARESSRAPPQAASAAPRKRKPLHWHLPQRILFELPPVSVRSDIVSTYILREATSPSEEEPSAVPLPVSELLAALISVLTDETDWDLVSYILCHLPFQLANRYLFCGPRAQDQVLKLRQLLCSKLPSSSLCSKATLPHDLRRTDLIAVAYFSLHILISYRTLFTRSQQDEMVDAFFSGLNKSQNTAKACVRALSIAALELQKSFTRLLSNGMVKLSTVMSSTAMSVHILELIASIGHMPSCYVNFTESDYRRVFGIALQYIQYHQSSNAAREDSKASPSAFALSQYVMMLAYYNLALWFMLLRVSERPKHMQAIARGLLLANDGLEKISEQTEVMFDFLARMTHANAQPKPKRSFINTALMGPSSVGIGRPGVKDATRITKSWLFGQSLVTITSLHRKSWLEIVIRRPSGSTSLLCKVENEDMELPELEDLPDMLVSERDPTEFSKPILRAGKLPRLVNGRLSIKDAIERLDGPHRWGVGRRPRALSHGEGTDIFSEDTALSMLPRKNDEDAAQAPSPYQGGENKVTRAMKEFMDGVMRAEGDPPQLRGDGENDKDAAAAPGKSSSVTMDPSFVALQLSSYPDINIDKAPLILPDEPATDRMIKAVDLTPVVDFHKIGVVYVGKGQTTEKEILGNRYGSAAYSRFIAGLGELVTLKNQESVYTGGLDRFNDEHGRFAYVWGDEITQIVYHTATLMPNKVEDPNHGSKKALIGNDWVHIVFNESGSEYTFGTIPSQFNYVNVVVSPDSRGGVDFGSVAMDDVIFYRVSLQRRPGMPEFSPVGDGVMVSADNLADFVRVLALNSNLMSQIYLDTGESMQPYTSNWVSRLRHLTRFRTQLEAKRAQAKGKEDLVITDPHEAITKVYGSA